MEPKSASLNEKNRKFIKNSLSLGGEAETAAWRSSSGEKGVKTKARLLSIIDDMRKVKALAAIHMALEIMGRYLCAVFGKKKFCYCSGFINFFSRWP